MKDDKKTTQKLVELPGVWGRKRDSLSNNEMAKCHAGVTVQTSRPGVWGRNGSHTKAVRKVGELTTRMRDEGVLAKQGRPKKITAGDDSEKTSRDVMFLSDLGINPNIAAAGVKLLALTPVRIADRRHPAARGARAIDSRCRPVMLHHTPFGVVSPP
jgi:hypothetical protein